MQAKRRVRLILIDGEGELIFSVEAFMPPGTPIEPLALHMAKALGSTVAFFHRTYWDLTGDKGE